LNHIGKVHRALDKSPAKSSCRRGNRADGNASALECLSKLACKRAAFFSGSVYSFFNGRIVIGDLTKRSSKFILSSPSIRTLDNVSGYFFTLRSSFGAWSINSAYLCTDWYFIPIAIVRSISVVYMR
jgi:hypothetical protein